VYIKKEEINPKKDNKKTVDICPLISYNIARNNERINMEIDVRSKNSAYITIGDWVFYIDNSTNEQIMECWNKKEEKYDLEYETKNNK